MQGPLDATLMGIYTIQWPKHGVASPRQILNAYLYWWFLSTPDEFWHETSFIGYYIFLAFRAYVERPKKWRSYATWVSDLVWLTPGLRNGLKIESDLDSNLA
jgi:hypothetical protein